MEHPFDLNELYIHEYPGNSNLKPVLFLHGNTQNSTCGTGVIEFFRSKGHRVVVWELPGHGLSKLTVDHYKFSDLVALNSQIIEKYHLQQGLLVGHSIGGMIILASVIERQFDDASLLLMGSLDKNPIEAVKEHNLSDALYMQTSLDSYMEAGDGLFKRQRQYDYFENRHLDDSFTEIFNRRYTQPLANRINLTSLAEYDVREQLSSTPRVMLVLHGAKEEVIPPALVEDMMTHYPWALLEWFPEGGHNAFFQHHELTVTFLKKHYDRLCTNNLSVLRSKAEA
ncbi:alpha/beta fold hydrolase [Pleionea litopenaei]|uniref:Alpha/beta hydrolase n=1 Tax=Pleionea litopenaei TaxID=3070815 RepID=A0AA51RW23_9GAMM|nr:alpha/beta hydrolase [Pleionea sp. HL-JVS1]WMS88514.1 alpha/beta hydrolase [Pleionea sp. HL-JVS1]